MKIIIVGSGKLGSYLSNILSKENYNITVIDKNKDALNKLNSTQDISIVCGNGLVTDTLLEADVNTSDILIASMKNDEDNIVCCLLAKNLGVKSTIMRIRNPQYNKTMPYIQSDLGLSMTINPEALAAAEIVNQLKFPISVKSNYFSKGRIEIVEFKIKENSPLINLHVKDLNNMLKRKVIVFAVERNNEVYIPNGDFKFELNDKLAITSSTSNIAYFFKQMGNFKQKTSNVMIVGGSKLSYYLAKFLNEAKIDVKIIENDKAKCHALESQLPKTLIINGDGSDSHLLLEEGIEETDAFISTTGIDEENIIFSIFAKNKKVPKVITKINHVNFDEVIDSLEIDSIITPHIIASNHVLKYIRAKENSKGGNMETLVRLMKNKLEIMEFIINNDFKALNEQIKNIKFKKDLLIVCIRRNKNIIFPTGEEFIRKDDSMIIATTKMNIKGLNDILR